MFYTIIARPLCWIFYKLFYRVKVIGKENIKKKGRCVVICNHLGKMDVLAVGALYPDKTYFLSKIEWFDSKFRSWLFKSLGAIPLNREKPDLSTIKEALKVLKENKRLGIFPEGARNFTANNLQEIKQGATMFAIRGKSTITPVIIYDHLKMFKKNYVMVGKEIDFSEYYNVRYTDEVAETCTKIMASRMSELQQELFKYVEENTKKRK